MLVVTSNSKKLDGKKITNSKWVLPEEFEQHLSAHQLVFDVLLCRCQHPKNAHDQRTLKHIATSNQSLTTTTHSLTGYNLNVESLELPHRLLLST